MMEKGILLDLKSIEILSEIKVKRLKQYILKKYSGEDEKNQSLVFADAVKKIVGSKIPECDEPANDRLKMQVIRNALKKQAFSVDCSDVFVSAIEMRWQENLLLDSLAKWTNSTLKRDIPGDEFKKFISHVYSTLDENPDLSIENIIENIDEVSEQDESLKEAKGTEKVQKIEEAKEVEEAQEVEKAQETAVKIERPPVRAWKAKSLIRPAYIGKRTFLICSMCLMLLYCFGIYWLGSTKVEADNEKYMGAVAISTIEEPVRRSMVRRLNMRATAYDLSYESCKKNRDHPEYGITYSGRRAVLGRTVAVDPKTIPLGSQLYIVFPKKYSDLNGIYFAEDIGSAVKGDIIDIFLGEDKVGESIIAKKVREFGVRNVEVYVLKEGAS